MFLTEPQSPHYDAGKFRALSENANHFDWDLYYRFKPERDRFWLKYFETDRLFSKKVEEHFNEFQLSVDKTGRVLQNIRTPKILDIGLSSEKMDKYLLNKLGAEVTVIDIQKEAQEYHQRLFRGSGDFILADVLRYSKEQKNVSKYDLVYSIGLVEHFPDKTDILNAHIGLTEIGGIVLIYVPIDNSLNRDLTGLASEWENFGYRELLTPAELDEICGHSSLETISVESVGFFSALWARRKK